jgi:uncharacterized protein YjbJ (UPF0337 family)
LSMGDKIKHAGEEAVGKVKEVTGKVTGNEDLEATRRGRASQGQRQAGRGQRQGRRRRRFGQLISGTRAPSSIPGAVPWSGHRRRHLPFCPISSGLRRLHRSVQDLATRRETRADGHSTPCRGLIDCETTAVRVERQSAPASRRARRLARAVSVTVSSTDDREMRPRSVNDEYLRRRNTEAGLTRRCGG